MNTILIILAILTSLHNYLIESLRWTSKTSISEPKSIYLLIHVPKLISRKHYPTLPSPTITTFFHHSVKLLVHFVYDNRVNSQMYFGHSFVNCPWMSFSTEMFIILLSMIYKTLPGNRFFNHYYYLVFIFNILYRLIGNEDGKYPVPHCNDANFWHKSIFFHKKHPYT